MCGCSAPNVVCNGNCVSPGACPSTQVAFKRHWVSSVSCTEKGLGWVACGVFGGSNRAWECINTARDLESCECAWPYSNSAAENHYIYVFFDPGGGCVLPLTPFSPIGEDCSVLPGVTDVSCLSGECVIGRCMPGHALSSLPKSTSSRPTSRCPTRSISRRYVMDSSTARFRGTDRQLLVLTQYEFEQAPSKKKMVLSTLPHTVFTTFNAQDLPSLLPPLFDGCVLSDACRNPWSG